MLRPPSAPGSPVLQVLDAAQALEAPVHHDGQPRAEGLTLLHAGRRRAQLKGRQPSPQLAGRGTGRLLAALQPLPPYSPLELLNPAHPFSLAPQEPGCLSLRPAHLCEVRTTERPVLMMSKMRFQRKRRAFGSMPVVGSSCCNGGDQGAGLGPARGGPKAGWHPRHQSTRAEERSVPRNLPAGSLSPPSLLTRKMKAG